MRFCPNRIGTQTTAPGVFGAAWCCVFARSAKDRKRPRPACLAQLGVAFPSEAHRNAHDPARRVWRGSVVLFCPKRTGTQTTVFGATWRAYSLPDSCPCLGEACLAQLSGAGTHTTAPGVFGAVRRCFFAQSTPERVAFPSEAHRNAHDPARRVWRGSVVLFCPKRTRTRTTAHETRNLAA